MFEYFRNILTAAPERANSGYGMQKKLQVATCALYFEMAKADDKFTDVEHKKIISMMKEEFDLGEEDVDELIQQTKESIRRSVSIYEFTTIIDQNLPRDEKLKLMKNLWRLIYLDGKLDKYEDNLVKRIGDMLKLEHKEVIESKLLVKNELNLN
ncbi:MAG TPA: TerB family tellurite resistance protein [Ignavibacteriaceae bacterium]|nr:TerB family tellurite resistance protein [Ignavibacteriaceae bacterium]